MNFGVEGFTGHQNGLIGQSATPACGRPNRSGERLAPYSAGCGSKVHAVSVPASLDTPSRLSTSCDSSFRVMMSDRPQ